MISACYFDKGDFARLQEDALVLEIAALGEREAALALVCDGIGGLREGEYAAGYVTMRVRDWFYRDFLRHVRSGHGRRRIVRDCVGMLYDCNRYLLRYGRARKIGLGTTMTMVLLYDGRFPGALKRRCPAQYLVFHVGDSRAYLFGRGLKKLTEDDSGGGNALSKCIGSFSWKGVQAGRGHLRRGERLLVCSDGFWRKLEEREMLESLGEEYRAGRGGRREMTEEQLERRLHKLGWTGRSRGERDNQAAAALGK